jgi:uncharacterized protein YjlB
VRARKAASFRFKGDGVVPNHPRWPLVYYRGAVHLAGGVDPAAVFEDLFERNGWADSWRNGVYDYLHYHSAIHEVMGVARGTAVVRFGGRRGRKLRVKAGDVVVLPQERATSAFPRARISSSSALIRRPANTTCAELRPKNTHARSRRFRKSCRRAATRFMANTAGC